VDTVAISLRMVKRAFAALERHFFTVPVGFSTGDRQSKNSVTTRSRKCSRPLSWITTTRLPGASRSVHSSYCPLGRNVLNTKTVDTCDAAEAAKRLWGFIGSPA
jgi:hypothetical protein